MTKDPQEVILCVLEKIKYQVDLAPKDKLDIRKILAEDKREGIVRSIRNIMSSYNLGVRLMVSEVREKCGINFYELENVLGKIKGVKAIYEFIPIAKLGYFQILPSPKLNKIYQTIQEINENPWFSEISKLVRIKKLLEGKRKQSEGKIDNNDKFYPEIISPKEVLTIKQVEERIKKYEEKTALKKEVIEEVNKELEEKRKVFEKLGKQFSSLIPPDNIHAWERYKELSQEISKQAEPMKKALEQLNVVYSGSIQNSLAPVLQRLALSLKRLEEQIKNFNELYKTPDYSLSEAIISPNLIRAQQEAEIISELKEVRKLIEKSTIKKDEPIPIKWFNHKNNSISFYGEIYKPRNEPQAKFIRQLVMRHQRENNNGIVLKEGQRVSENNLSSEINSTIEQLRQVKKQLKRSFKDKGFPLKIDSNAEGVLLIYTI